MNDSTQESPLWDEESAKPKRATALLAGLGVTLVVALLYVGAAWYFGQRTPGDTTIGGVAVGGRTPAEATATLRRELGDGATTPIPLAVGSKTVEIDPAEVGLAYDYEASVEGITGFSLNPATLYRHLTGGVERDIVRVVDEDRLAAAVTAATKGLGTKPRDGSVAFVEGKVVTKKSRVGLDIDEAGTARAVASAWPTAEPVKAVTTDVPPVLSNDEITRFASEFAEPIVSGPVTVRAGGHTFSVPGTDFVPAVTITTTKGTLAGSFDHDKVVERVQAAAASAGATRAAVNATVSFSGGRASVTPSTTGRALNTDGVAAAVEKALVSTSARSVTVRLKATEPDLTTAKAKATLPKEQISTFTTQFDPTAPRGKNIIRAASVLNGTYVAPGQQFSLNGVLGERTAAKGYHEAPAIYNGRLVKDYGGGISQLSTTLFNAVFFSGAQIDAFTPHSFYISRYPEGREATINWPTVDQRFTNDTKGGILIQAGTSGGNVTVTFIGRKTWDITASKGPRRNVTQPKKIKDDSADCVPQVAATGFDVTVTRIFRSGGTIVKRQEFNTHYIPEDDVTCTNPKAFD
ncbi:VanW family protein [Janibacter sp. G56]|uniref:VanW family protein n=1 Tax=Janibacter sp. G56 TaxID=3418717 RepID=UPI003D014EB7